jgi:branched-chain amino acid transport system ATP-binding protein
MNPASPKALILDIADLQVQYGASRILQGLTLELSEGEAIAVVGRNGVGKTTLLRAIMGLVKASAGNIRFGGSEIVGRKAHEIARAGIGYVPQGRRIFGSLSVTENLTAVESRNQPGRRWTTEAIFARFRNLDERRQVGGKKLSGGEQQMLAIGRALVTNPRLLLLDEPVEGLSPAMIDALDGLIADFRSDGTSVILVEQDLHYAARCTDRLVLMERGRISHQASTSDPAAVAAIEARLAEVPMTHA